MNLSAIAAGVLALTISATVGGPSLSSAVFAPESRLTSLAPEACRSDPRRPAAEPIETGRRHCPGAGGARVLVERVQGGTSLGFAWSQRDRSVDVVRGAGFGTSLEWRGHPTARGFAPFAVLLRAASTAPDETISGPTTMLVLRIRAGEACLIGTVSAITAAAAADAARRMADAHARTATCERASPTPGGAAA